MSEMRNQRGEQLKDPLIKIKIVLVLLPTVLETFASGKACFYLQMKRKVSLDCGFISINFSLKTSRKCILQLPFNTNKG
jgi:hypothetical protein